MYAAVDHKAQDGVQTLPAPLKVERPNASHNFKTPVHRAKETLNVTRLHLDFALTL